MHIRKIGTAFAIALTTFALSACGKAAPKSAEVSEDKIAEFLDDTVTGVSYMYIYDTDYAEHDALDSDIELRLAAASIYANNGELADNGNYDIIPADTMEKELVELFGDSSMSESFDGNNYVMKDGNGDYQILLGDWGTAQPYYTIDSTTVDSSTGETDLTIHYSLKDMEEDKELTDQYYYLVKLGVVSDDSSSYGFRIVSFSGHSDTK